MKTLRNPLIGLLLALLALAATGCTSRTAQDSSMPWSRPANWEGQIPGMGQTPGSGVR
jgi:hypothetical protein